MYLEMIKTILGIEFYEGVHSETESGDFFYISQRNHVVLDNFMAQSGRDKRISDEARVKRLGRGCRYTRKRQRREPHRGVWRHTHPNNFGFLGSLKRYFLHFEARFMH